MSENANVTAQSPAGRDEVLSALFAQMVLQMSGLAMMLMGETPHPETGQTMKDHQAAKLIIDQLEMLDVKTRGNLSKDENALLSGTLTNLRLTYVQTLGSTSAARTPAGAEKPSAPAPAENQAAPSEKAAEAAAKTPDSDHESKVRYSKKY